MPSPLLNPTTTSLELARRTVPNRTPAPEASPSPLPPLRASHPGELGIERIRFSSPTMANTLPRPIQPIPASPDPGDHTIVLTDVSGRRRLLSQLSSPHARLQLPSPRVVAAENCIWMAAERRAPNDQVLHDPLHPFSFSVQALI